MKYGSTLELAHDMMEKETKASELLGVEDSGWDVDEFPFCYELSVCYIGLREHMWDRMVDEGLDLSLWRYMDHIGIRGAVSIAVANDRPMPVRSLLNACRKAGCPVDRAMSYRSSDDKG